jgi:hypothetical protein
MHAACPRTRDEITVAVNKRVAARRQDNVCRREERTLRSGHLSKQAPTTPCPRADEYVRMRHQRIQRGLRNFLVTRRLSLQHRQAARLALVATNGNQHRAWRRLKDLELTPSATGERSSQRLQSNSSQCVQDDQVAQWMETQTTWEIVQDVRRQWRLHGKSVRMEITQDRGYGLFPTTTLYQTKGFRLDYVGEWNRSKSEHNRYQLQHTLDGAVQYFITPLGSDDKDQPRRKLKSLPPAAYVNHPRQGKTATLRWNVANVVPFMELAVPSVNPTDELTIDYGETYWKSPLRCRV